MARMRIFVMLALALTAGGGLAYGTYSYMHQVPIKAVEVPTRPVLVSAVDLQIGETVEADDVKTVRWPADTVPEGALSESNQVVGRSVLASLVRHELLLEGKLAPIEAGNGLPPVIPAGMRAVSVRVNEVIGVAGYVLPGTHVDVLATASPTDQREDTTTKVVLTNVRVLAAGTRLEKSGDAAPMQVSVVTLIVTPAEAERLTLASTEGKIQLALRNPLDVESPQTSGVQAAVLLGTPQPPPPAPAPTARRARAVPPPSAPPPPQPTIEVISGDQRSNVTVK